MPDVEGGIQLVEREVFEERGVEDELAVDDLAEEIEVHPGRRRRRRGGVDKESATTGSSRRREEPPVLGDGELVPRRLGNRNKMGWRETWWELERRQDRR